MYWSWPAVLLLYGPVANAVADVPAVAVDYLHRVELLHLDWRLLVPTHFRYILVLQFLTLSLTLCLFSGGRVIFCPLNLFVFGLSVDHHRQRVNY